MCIIIDTNVFPQVFDPENQGHSQYRPVLEWIIKGRGKLVCGGSKFRKEMGKNLRIFASLQKLNKLVKYDDDTVDKEQFRVIELFKSKFKSDNSYRKEFERIDREIATLQPPTEAEKKKYLTYEWKVNPNFDDPHLVALLRVSKCRLVCSEDMRSKSFLKANYFVASKNRPKIYSSGTFPRAKDILNDKHIVDCCKPEVKLAKRLVNEWFGNL